MGADAHHKAMQGLPANGVCTEAQLTAINAGIGRMIASVPEATTMDLYNSVSALVDTKVPPFLMSSVKEADARTAYDAFIEFKNVVKANPINPSTPVTKVSSGAADAIENMDAKGVRSLADYTAVNTGLGKAIASVSQSTTMDVYNAMAKLVGITPIPNMMFSRVNPQDAQAAYNAFLDFKDVVKASQR